MDWPQLQIGLRESRKQCLNLCCQRWPRPNLGSMVRNLTSMGLWHLKTLLPEGSINFKSFFWKICRFSEFHIFLSSLFHSITTKRKKEFRKELCFTLKWGILLAFLVLYGLAEVGIILNKYFEDWFLNILKKQQSFLYHLLFTRVFKPGSW